jgi:molybdopterin molybdotransferase
MPPGADTVVIRENTRPHGDDVVVLAPPLPGQNVRRAGEDVQPGDIVLQAGQVLTPARVALAAALGIADLEVSQRPTVAVFATGDELVEPGLPLQPGQVYNSNRELLMGLLRADGLEPTAWPVLPDEPVRLRAMLLDAADSFDVVLTCGAVSAGEKDHIPGLLREAGQVHFWKVRMRPGMPLLFGGLGRALLLGLPGNPVSVLATWLTMGRVVIDALQGRTEPRTRLRARLASPWHKRHERLEFLRGRLRSGDDGTLLAEPNPADGSHRMRGAADSDVLIVLPEGERAFAAGEVVEVLTY